MAGKMSDADIRAYVRDHHKEETIGAMARAAGTSWEKVGRIVREMGLEAAPRSAPWTEADVHGLRSMAAAGADIAAIAEALGRTENAVRLKAGKLGVMVYQEGRAWSVEELDTLRREWGYINVSMIAKHVHRTVDAVCQQAHKMRLGPVYGLSEDLALSGFCEATGISRDRVRQLALKYEFPLVSHKYGKRQYYYFVDIEAILPWMERHQGLFDGSAVEEGYFVPEPEWLVRKRRRDREDNTYLPYNIRKEWWTRQEIDRAKYLMRIGRSYRQIAAELGRSPLALAAKMRSEGASFTLKTFWQVSEFRFVRENWESMSDEEIGKKLGRSAGAVAGQRAAMGLYRDCDVDADGRALIRDRWTGLPDTELARMVGAHPRAVARARREMGLFREGEWSDADSDFVLEHWESMSDPEIADALGHSEHAVKRHRWDMGLARPGGKPAHRGGTGKGP